MVFLKEDGSLDIERIDSLPHDERVRMIGKMTEKELECYLKSFPMNEDKKQPIKVIKVSYGFDDPRNGVDAFEFLDELEKEFL